MVELSKPLFALAVVASLACAPRATAHAQPATPSTHPAARSGPAIAFGLGNPYAGIGGHVAYHVRFANSPFVVAPYAGAGWCFGDFGPVFGVIGTYGAAGRWLLDAGFGAFGTDTLVLHGAEVASRVGYAAYLTGGAEWMSSDGIAVRLSIGPAFITDPYFDGDASERLTLSLNFGLGFKP